MNKAEYDYVYYSNKFLILSYMFILERIALETDEGNLNAYGCLNSNEGLGQTFQNIKHSFDIGKTSFTVSACGVISIGGKVKISNKGVKFGITYGAGGGFEFSWKSKSNKNSSSQGYGGGSRKSW